MSACPQFSHDEHTRAFHQHEWGEPVSDSAILFEYLILYTFTAALPLDWVLKRREDFRDALCNFEPARLARFSDDDIADFCKTRSSSATAARPKPPARTPRLGCSCAPT